MEPHKRTKARALRSGMLALALAGCLGGAAAQDLKEQARNAAIGDGFSTAVGLAAGAVEMNPLGPVLAIGMKAVVFEYIETLPDVEQPRAYARAASTWSGAVANNICVTAALLTGGGFAPACIIVGIAWGMKTWHDTAPRRQLAENCARLRLHAGRPELACMESAGQLQAAADASFVDAQALQVP